MPESATSLAPPEPAASARDEHIVYFDGVCGLCNRFVDDLIRRDVRGKFKFAPLQGDTARQNLPEELVRELSTVIFQSGGRYWKRSAAIVRIGWQLGGVWKVLAAALWLIPLPLRNLGYRLVAKWRYRLFGKKETCRLPTPEERARFLP